MTSDFSLIGERRNIGLVQWFCLDAYKEAGQVIEDFKQLGIKEIRTNISQDYWMKPGGRTWYDWLLAALSAETKILPCLVPSSAQDENDTSLNGSQRGNYASFVDSILAAYGNYFDFVEIQSASDNNTLSYTTSDTYLHFHDAANVCRKYGKKVVFSIRLDLHLTEDFVNLAEQVDVLGISRGSSNNKQAFSWNNEVMQLKHALQNSGLEKSIWITEAAHPTAKNDERRQLKEFINAIEAPVEKVFWNTLLHSNVGNHDDGRQLYGMKNSDGSPRLLYTMLANVGGQNIDEYKWMTEKVSGRQTEPYVLITGGAGFVGVNLADSLLTKRKKVMIFDNLSRAGVETNLLWLRNKHPQSLSIMIADIRDKAAVQHAVSNAKFVYHFAAQVAVTSSLIDPYHDFEVNALGTLNVVEAVRHSTHQPPIVFTSTNKVYGDLHDLGIVMNCTRYHPESLHFRNNGISEERPLDFHSPYGCTKGVADQYILDYARTFGLKTVVFRMSCIYGLHQFGNEDQGWVAHFLIQALKNKPITLYGDGKQVRDILFIQDLVNAFEIAMNEIDSLSGSAFNMGGGVDNSISLLELINLIGDVAGAKPEVKFSDWRPSDQKYYVSDHSKFTAHTGWRPKVGTREGVETLYNWLQQHRIQPQSNKIKAPLVSETVIA